MLSLAIILYFFGRALPRISDQEITEALEVRSHRLTPYLEKVDKWLKSRLERILRRTKVVLLKMDNVVSQKLNSFKKEDDRNGASSDIFSQDE